MSAENVRDRQIVAHLREEELNLRDSLMDVRRQLIELGVTPNDNTFFLKRTRRRTIEFNASSRTIKTNGKTARNLPPLEASILYALVYNKDRLLSRTYLINYLWQDDYLPNDPINNLKGYICTLRRRLRKISPDLERHIVTERGIGYFWDSQNSAAKAKMIKK